MRHPALLVIGACLFLPAQRAAADTGAGLGARALGMGGAGAGLMSGSEALFYNPAGLGGTQGLQLGALAGLGALGDGSTQALVVALPAATGILALAAQDSRFGQLGAYREQRLAAGLAIPVASSLWLGTRQQFLTSNLGEMRGWSMDMGLHWDASASLWGGQGVELGLAAQDLFSELSWSGGESESLPPSLSAALTLSPWSSGRVNLQADLTERADLGRENQWRLGAEQWFWPRHAALRAGYNAGDAAPAQTSAGAGFRFPLLGQAWALDYAALFSDGSAGLTQAVRHLFTLTVEIGSGSTAAPPLRTRISSRPKVVGAQLALPIIRPNYSDPVPRSWEMVLRNDQGAVLRSYRGKGALPERLVWDGTNEDGVQVPQSGVAYTQRTVDEQGRVLTRHSILLAGAGEIDTIGSFVSKPGKRAYGLRADNGAASAAGRTRVRPRLRDRAGQDPQGASFDLHKWSNQKVKKWSLKVVDEQGRTVRSFSGRGKPPRELDWDGLADIGQAAPRRAGAGFLLRITDKHGDETAETGDIPTALAGARPKLPVSSLRLKALESGLARCSIKADYSECRCVLHFDSLSSVILSEDLPTLWSLAEFARSAGLSDLTVHGFTDDLSSPEFNWQLSEQRADTIFDWLKALRLIPEEADIAGFGQGSPVATNNTDQGRAQNRRVEVTVRRPIL